MSDYKKNLKHQKEYAQKRLAELGGEGPPAEGMAATIGAVFGPTQKLKAVNKRARKAAPKSVGDQKKKAVYERVIREANKYGA